MCELNSVPGLQGSIQADDPVAAFLAREQARCTDIAAAVDASMADVCALLQHSRDARASDAAAAITALLQDRTPEHWQSTWEGPNEAKAFMSALAQRASGCTELARRHAAGALLGNLEAVPLHHLFDPHGLISTLRHVCAARRGVSIDALVLRNAWSMQELAGTCEAPLAVGGIAIEGAVFDGRALAHVSSGDPETAPLQNVVLGWVAGGPQGVHAGSFALPLYASRARERLLLHLHVPSRSHTQARELTLAGAAAFVES